MVIFNMADVLYYNISDYFRVLFLSMVVVLVPEKVEWKGIPSEMEETASCSTLRYIVQPLDCSILLDCVYSGLPCIPSFQTNDPRLNGTAFRIPNAIKWDHAVKLLMEHSAWKGQVIQYLVRFLGF